MLVITKVIYLSLIFAFFKNKASIGIIATPPYSPTYAPTSLIVSFEATQVYLITLSLAILQ